MTRTAILAAASALLSASTAAAACTAPAAGEDLTEAQAAEVYACLAADMQAGYARGPKRWIDAAYVADYRSWTAASTGPAAPGVHGARFLMTWVNPVGAEAYLRFDEEGAKMPAGTVIAKESFTVDASGAAAPGPLFFMEKAAPGASPETGDWYYMMVSARGAPVAVPVVQACHDCHSGFEDSDFLGYPAEEVRAGG
ncbi:cytochrome P460 family protein [Rhodovulum sp. DZ06]|uniref:cytochrome P460 family protein n=1 Tax=Rhodovulum sp. DZ06 TaxID=3425126 RepID=UPI003D33E56E